MNSLTKQQKRTRLAERLAFWSFRLATYFIIACTSYIFLDIGVKGARTVFTTTAPFVNLDFLSETPETLYVFEFEGKKMSLGDQDFRAWKAQHPAAEVNPTTVAYSAGGIWPCIVGTALLVIGSMIIAFVHRHFERDLLERIQSQHSLHPPHPDCDSQSRGRAFDRFRALRVRPLCYLL